ncbi:thermonuclease family protein [Phototrophicus methaneseepsis]|uniref:Thermonuclease family protein n=1 Tax=Phototrophicus methaneseepsis TaxID=2710758 RepID=A0A7S8IEE5_9CHLR|nr:thermonuclease family protein [Phototrophicus methaneseepsis]QPC82516.1 thermonuclease family protein [Phototrophicus methaneseepsis]
MKQLKVVSSIVVCMLFIAGCNLDTTGSPATLPTTDPAPQDGELARVLYVVDGDTIAVELNGVEERVRYIGVNTPERDEVCYEEATDANASLVEGEMVRMVPDVSDRDRYDRLLRYIYVGNTFVNEQLVAYGYAEAVLYEPDDREFDNFHNLEVQAAASGLGCHPTGIFNDGSDRR